jgi:hypothetical protein
MIGTHLLGLAVIAIELVFVLTAPRGYWTAFAMIPFVPAVWILRLERRFFARRDAG